MKRTILAFSLCSALFSGAAFADHDRAPAAVPHLDHVFVIMMENHNYGQVLNNPNAPFINKYAQTANLATNYYGVAHPSLTNYLEVVGGSNFGVLSDHSPAWHDASCTPNLASGVVNNEAASPAEVCPISGTGTDAATPAIDKSGNETSNPAGMVNVDGKVSFPASSNIIGETIADQLVAHNLSWKAYEEGLPPHGADRVNTADGFYSNLTDFSAINTPEVTLSQSDIVGLYASKHDPFAYFQNVQEGTNPRNSLANVVGFEGAKGLFADLRAGRVPSYSFIAPSQCNDMHGRGNGGPMCAYDPKWPATGLQKDTNPALIHRGDVTVKKIVQAIHASPVWHRGHNAIVVLWDENDYAVAPSTNHVMTIVDTNYGAHGVKSNNLYTHFSLLKTIDQGFGLPCLNHACDANVQAMTDLFGGHGRNHEDDNDAD